MTRSRSWRVWAWIALAAAAGVLATLVVLLFRNLGALVFAVLALGLAGAAAWVALTRRGIVRVLGIAVAGKRTPFGKPSPFRRPRGHPRRSGRSC